MFAAADVNYDVTWQRLNGSIFLRLRRRARNQPLLGDPASSPSARHAGLPGTLESVLVHFVQFA